MKLLNEQVELESAAEYLLNNILPKPGTLFLGESGMEYVPDEGATGVRVRWSELECMHCDIFRRRVRSLEVHVDDGRVVVFSVADGVEALRVIAAHVGREKLVSVNDEARQQAMARPGLLDRVRELVGRPRVEHVELVEEDEEA